MTTPSDSTTAPDYSPSLTPHQRAGHALRVKATALAEAVVAEQYRLRPELAAHYGQAGRRHCLADAHHHMNFLAGSVEFNDPKVFADYVEWVVDLLAKRGIPSGEVSDNLRVLEGVLAGSLPPSTWVLVRQHVRAGMSRADSTAVG